ncbi:hypothetical protein GCM10018952_74360 [Streptosporangium vulgare]
MPDGGGGVQRGDERGALAVVGALGEQLLELVDEQDQPPLPIRFWDCRLLPVRF